MAALKSWGHDTGDLENADDVAARERYARGAAGRASFRVGDPTGGYDDDPPF